jgi:hypothetical protein
VPALAYRERHTHWRLTVDRRGQRKQAAIAGCGDGETIERTGTATLFITFFTSGGLVRALAVAGHNSVLGC